MAFPTSATNLTNTIDTSLRRFRLNPAVRAFGVRYLPLVHFAVDSATWVLAVLLTTWLRYDFDLSRVDLHLVLGAAAIAVALQGTFGLLTGLYRRRWRYGSFEEVVALATTTLLTGTGLTVFTLALVPDLQPTPRSAPPMATAFTITGAIAARSVWRLARARRRRPEAAERIVVVGAGSAGESIVRNLLDDKRSPYLPVALIDDDRHKARRRMQGVAVEGTVDRLALVARRRQVNTVLLAIPSGDGELVRRVQAHCDEAGLKLLVLPRVSDLLGAPGIADIRPVTVADLLGRPPAEIDPESVAGYITGRRVLVTGAGGSIGSELCRQLALLAPAELMMLDRDESGLHATQLSIEGRALLDDPNLILADIRDRDRLIDVFVERRPEVVFHAAALKHLTLLEQAPAEAWKTNVVGTQNVLDAATAAGVGHFVNISTDKAANPVSVLGFSKRLTERLTANRAAEAAGRFVSVRFGNVLGSRGSVLGIFQAQAEGGGPLTVTDPDVTRFFMTVQEAVRLSIYAGSIGTSGDVLVLDMGEPVRIADVAARIAAQYDPAPGIVYTGLRPGEKLNEELFGDDEDRRSPVHPLINRVAVPAMSFETAEALVLLEGPATTASLRSAVRLELDPDRFLDVG